MSYIFEREIQKSLKKQSFFLFGPRQSGKTTLITGWLKGLEKHFSINLMKSEVLIKYQTGPSQLRKEIEYEISKCRGSLCVFIDEIQKCPQLLDEVQVLIDEQQERVFFVLTGSSARKLKRASANMLGGRALRKTMHPLSFRELAHEFDLEKVLSGGSLPPFYLKGNADKSDGLHSYVTTYLKEEVMQEALTRNVPAFSRFLILAGECSGELINYSNIAREAGVSSKTVKEYYQILEDTLIGFPLYPYLKSTRKQLIRHPRFYLFDTGVINQLSGRSVSTISPGTSAWGRLFEHFIILEIKRYIDCFRKSWRMSHWRTKPGHEVDLVLDTEHGLFAIEIKGGRNIGKRDLKGLHLLHEEFPDSVPLCVGNVDAPFLIDNIPVIPWKMLFNEEYLDRS